MYLFCESLPTPQENLAVDEALVEVADRCSFDRSEGESDELDERSTSEVLRLWELPSACVVLGRASKHAEEVDSVACQRDGVAVLRRVSGGATIVAGPGCLMYSLLISYYRRPTWRELDVAHREVMNRIRDAVQRSTDSFQLELPIAINGTCDLTVYDRKFSGNALRCKRHWMLYHGTIMYAMPLHWLSDYLREPRRQPEYRRKREHGLFVTNLLDASSSVSKTMFRNELERQLAWKWNATQSWQTNPSKLDVELETEQLLNSRYSDPQWHLSR